MKYLWILTDADLTLLRSVLTAAGTEHSTFQELLERLESPDATIGPGDDDFTALRFGCPTCGTVTFPVAD